MADQPRGVMHIGLCLDGEGLMWPGEVALIHRVTLGFRVVFQFDRWHLFHKWPVRECRADNHVFVFLARYVVLVVLLELSGDVAVYLILDVLEAERRPAHQSPQARRRLTLGGAHLHIFKPARRARVAI